MRNLTEEKLRKKLHDTQVILEEIRLFFMTHYVEDLPNDLPEKIDNILGYGEEK